MGEALRTVKQNIPNFIERWLVYALRQSQRGGSGASGAMGVAFRLIFDKWTKAFEYSKAYLTQHLDLERIMYLLDKAIFWERESREIFEEQLKQHPGSIQLMRAYGALLRDIYREDDTALQLFNEATSIQEDLALHDNQIYQQGIQQQQYQSEQFDRQSIISKVQQSMTQYSTGAKSGSSSVSASLKKKQKQKKKRNVQGVHIISAQNAQDLIPWFLQIVIGCMAIIINNRD
ncbi:MAG: hypothetical protein EZS28_017646 [Streblomastix strix]|uniref:TmcB/TmcC TPR repeats domain-containing protein n=1 Tax=Streblomastix strix TaxID=222440 RepID=A0A5J4VWX0_9EUKA|nr:MAG: hypothetical protein EZS28_017646 [Streblomastix strix]